MTTERNHCATYSSVVAYVQNGGGVEIEPGVSERISRVLCLCSEGTGRGDLHYMTRDLIKLMCIALCTYMYNLCFCKLNS